MLKLILRHLEAGLMEGGMPSARREETPQRVPLWPLLSNILLTDLIGDSAHRFGPLVFRPEMSTSIGSRWSNPTCFHNRGGLLNYIEQQCIRLPCMNMSKDLAAASATPLVLAILAEGDSYGYAIIKRVTELSGGHLQWTDGMLYPVLHRLERQGHVAAKWSASENGRRRRYYRITREGRAQLASQRQQWQVVDGTLRGIWMKECRA